MGASFSEGVVANVKTYSHPSKTDWITAHAKATGLNLVEVDRLWYRFQQLGCDANGMLNTSVFDRPPANNDVLAKNMLTAFGVQTDQDITFEQFLEIMAWATKATLDNKIRTIFYLLNGGQDISKDLLVRILTRTFTEGPDAENDIAEMTHDFMLLMDPEELGFIDEERFVRAVATVPMETLEAALHVSILPESDVPRLSQDLESPSPPMVSPSLSQSLPEARELPTDEELSEIASRVQRLDWQRLANKLGFLDNDIQRFEQHRGNSEQKVLQMLRRWREGDGASTDLLETALQDCGMTAAATVLATS